MNRNDFETGAVKALIRLVENFSPDDAIGVALSGGADSVALLSALNSGGVRVEALHCNFHLRGADSDGDAEFCRRLCSELNVPLSVVDFDTLSCQERGESVEMICRRLRYDWFEQQAAGRRLKAVAIAHHADDDVETVLMNLFRGTGLKGLGGIPSRRGIYVRPLLQFTRNQILEYLADCRLGYRTDASNFQNDYRRNAVRNVILPETERYFPDARKGVLTTSDHVMSSLNLLDEFVNERAFSSFDENGGLDVRKLLGATSNPFEMLYRGVAAVFPPGVNATVARDILAAVNASGGRFMLADGTPLVLSRGRLQKAVVQAADGYVLNDFTDASSWPFAVRICTMDKAGFAAAAKNNFTLFLDAAILDKPRRFKIRRWRSGDRLKPYGMKGSRLVSDIISDAKLDARRKAETLVLTCDDELLWVIGLRASRNFEVTQSVQRVISVELLK